MPRPNRTFQLPWVRGGRKPMSLKELIAVARAQSPGAVVLRNCRLVNVFSNDIHEADIAIHQGRIAGVGRGYRGDQEVDLGGSYLLPGLIDGHMHLESTMLSVPEFARAVLPHGTTTVVIDPHEIANVHGAAGILYMLAASHGLPLNVYAVLPSCVPASSFESSGAVLAAFDLVPLLDRARIVGLGEVMNFPGVLQGDDDLLNKIAAVRIAGGIIDGHAPGLRGHDLCAYVASGMMSDHESTTPEEAEEKIRLGIWLMVREGSSASNLHALLPVIRKLQPPRAMFVTDDCDARHLLRAGHMDVVVRRAIQGGLNPVVAIQMATLNPAQYFGLRDLGAVAPGYRADLVIVDDLERFQVRMVFKDGRLIARDGAVLAELAPVNPAGGQASVQLGNIGPQALRLAGKPGRARVIGVLPEQAVTSALMEDATCRDGALVADPNKDLLKLAVIERHHGSGRVGLGLVKGFALRNGAFASTVAHDAHNLIVAGVSDGDMWAAVEQIAAMGGGMVVVAGGKVLEALPLPIAGLMSSLPHREVVDRLEALDRALETLGCTIGQPFMRLSFLSLSVIPALKLTDRGLLDVERFRLIPVQD